MVANARPMLRSTAWWIVVTLAFPACSARVSTPPEFSAAVRRGDEAFQYKEYEKAVAAYRTYLDQTDHGLYTARTFYKSALAQYRLGHYREVLTTLDELSERYPKEHWVQVEVLRGDTARAMGTPPPRWRPGMLRGRSAAMPSVNNYVSGSSARRDSSATRSSPARGRS